MKPSENHRRCPISLPVVLLTLAACSSSRSVAYELRDDGTATRMFELEGDARQWVKIR